MGQTPHPTDKDSGLPDAIEASLVASLYGDPRTLLIGSVGTLSAVFLTAFATGSLVFVGCAMSLLFVALLRVREMSAFRAFGGQFASVSDVRRWELRYVAGATTYVLIMGLWCLLSFTSSMSAEVQLVSFATTLANMIGIAGRNYGSKRLVRAQLLAAGIPMLLGLIWAASLAYLVLAFVLGSFFISLEAIATRLRWTLTGAVVARHDSQRLAQRLDAALNTMPHGLLMFSEAGRVILSNQRLPAIIGLDEPALASTATLRAVARNLMATGLIGKLALRQAASASRRRLLENDDSPVDVRLADGRTLALTFRRGTEGAVALVEDTTEQRTTTERITYLAHNDVLTGLANRVVFRNEVSRILDELDQAAGCAVFFVDLDHFKEVNDTLGHPCGDQLLKIVARRLRSVIAEDDLIARWGGDEFVVARPRCGDKAELVQLAEAIVRELGRPYDVDGHVVIVGASVGIAIGPADGEDADLLLKNADLALYQAKASGRGAWRLFESNMGVEAGARRTLELDLREALTTGAFELAFQPIADLRGGRITACEALLRWNHPERGPVPPSVFIPIAEDIGLIVALGEFALRRACEEALTWPDTVRVAVNLSPLQFRSGNLPAMVERILSETGLPASRLELEITESVFIQGEQSTLKLLSDLKAFGLSISLDDFGTGYSSLAYLQTFPLDKVKIDRSFLIGASESARSLTLLAGIARLCRELSMSVVIEGVETAAQLDLVAALDDIAEVQGYLLSRPITGTAIRGLLGAFHGFPRQGFPRVEAAHDGAAEGAKAAG
jgi:diguanylate cyclase (GGDEF)-like protein